MDSPGAATLRWGMDPIVYERRGAAALVRIVRPERRNAIDGATADALHAAFARFVADEGARVLVLAGDAKAFSAGADLKAIETLRDRDEGPRGGDPRLRPHARRGAGARAPSRRRDLRRRPRGGGTVRRRAGPARSRRARLRKAIVFPVSPEKARALEETMRRLGVREEDLDEQFIRSRGRGGQNVNKVSTCVVLRHGPTGLVVRCERERSQALNRYLARRLLLEKLEARQRGVAEAAARERSRIRRQKRRRSRRAQEKVLAAKRALGEKKAARRPPAIDD